LVSFVTPKQRLPRSVEFGPLPGVDADRTDPSPFPNVRFVSYALDYLLAQTNQGRRVVLPPKLQVPCVVPNEVATGLWERDLAVLRAMRDHYNARVTALRSDATASGHSARGGDATAAAKEAALLSPLDIAETVLSVDRALSTVYMRVLERYTIRAATESASATAAAASAAWTGQESEDDSNTRLSRCVVGGGVKLVFQPIKGWSQNMIDAALAIVVHSISQEQLRCKTCPYRNPACPVVLPTAELFDKWDAKFKSDAVYHQCREQQRVSSELVCVICKREPRIIRAMPCGAYAPPPSPRAAIQPVCAQLIFASAAAAWRP
jgi:hypothetical protein